VSCDFNLPSAFFFFNPPPPALEKARAPLNAWGPAGAAAAAADPLAEEAEYAAALKLAGLIAVRAGPDGLASVWRAIHDRRAAYQPTSAGASAGAGVELSTAAPDWRGLLDLLEDQTGKRFDDLWSAWVVRPAETGLLTERAAARDRYDAIRTRAGLPGLPRVAVLAGALVIGFLVARRGRVWPHSWRAGIITAFFQTTINFGATTMANRGTLRVENNAR